MSKTKKILLLIFCILILTVFLPILVDYQQASDLGIQLFSWRELNFAAFISKYIFWGTLILSVLVLSSILVILFYPKQYLDIQLGTKDDKLKLKNSAIEGFVRCVVDDYELIKNPTIRVNVRRNKCFVYVEGRIITSDNVSTKCQSIQNEITQGLRQFFGLDREVKLEVLVKNYQPPTQHKKTTSRVD